MSTSGLRRDDTHGCSGDCGAWVPRGRLACPPCWYRLPGDLRAAVNEAYRHRSVNPAAHRAALADAMNWYRNNPKGAK